MRNFINYEYKELVEKLTKILQDKDGWGDAYNSSTGQTLIQLIADATDQLGYMLERRTQEQYLATSRIPRSVRALANSLSYRPRRKVSPTGTLQIRLIDDDGNTISPEGNVVIPRYTRIFYQDDTFVNTEDIIITPTDEEVEFSVMEGIPRLEVYGILTHETLSSLGFILLSDYEVIEENSLIVYDANDAEWLDIRRSYDGEVPKRALSFVEGDERFYDLRISHDGMRVVFGNNVFGKRPESDITLEWVESSGDETNIESTGLIFELEDSQLQDDINVTPPNTYDFEIINTTPIRGGLPSESIEDIKLKASEYFKTGDRAVTKDDYNFSIIRSGIGGIVDVHTYGQQEIGIDIFKMNNVYVTYLTALGDTLTQEQKQDLRDYLDIYKTITNHIVLEQAEEIKAQLNLNVSRRRTLRVSNSDLYEYLRDELADYLRFREGSIGRPLYYSELVKHLQELTITRDGVEQDIAVYLSLDIKPLTPFMNPIEVQEIVVPVTAGTTGDEYVLTINGEDALYTMQEGDSDNDIANGLSSVINTSIDNVSSTTDGNVITITSDLDEVAFSITNENSTDSDNVSIFQEIQLPPRFINNEHEEDQVLRGSIELVDVDNNVICGEDGNGTVLTSDAEYTSTNGTIDYITAKIEIPLLPNGEYYVRYNHDEFKNIYPNERSVIAYSLPKEQFIDEDERFSTIEISI